MLAFGAAGEAPEHGRAGNEEAGERRIEAPGEHENRAALDGAERTGLAGRQGKSVQRERALSGLLRDGLAVGTPDTGYRLPE